MHPWMAPAFSESARAQLAADEAAAEALQKCFDLAVAEELQKRMAEHNKADEEMLVTMRGMLKALRDDEARAFSQDSVSPESAKLISSMQPIYSRIAARNNILVPLRKASKKATQAPKKATKDAPKKAKPCRTEDQLRADAVLAFAASLARNAAKDAQPQDETASNAEDDDVPDDDPPVSDRHQRCIHLIKGDQPRLP